ncbi:LAME_0H20054g1_1 [Lachancea meyersii CBS 8951]|uniref:LAME_0H20054g1_1 n=1 Tax=Lachancea meyersii CBS 8951 TaxID=1266667 RepID=A0A1G4KJH6_9SACH|nr:LAME_0H20054g1_1 [Lachancea meyersii CBS 8951]
MPINSKMRDESPFDRHDSSVDASDYFSAASSIGAGPRDTELVCDSQESDVLTDQKHHLNDNLSLSESLSSESELEDPLQDLGIFSGISGPKADIDIARESHFVEFETGTHFDDNIVERLDRFEQLTKTLDAAETELPKPRDVIEENYHLLLSIFKHEVPDAYLEMVAHENSDSQRFRDWHFLIEDTRVVRPDAWEMFLNSEMKPSKRSLRALLRSFGAVKFMPENTEGINTHMYDTLNHLESVEWMCYELEKYVNSSGFTRTFIRFILDRNVYNSAECTVTWCSRIYDQLCEKYFLQVYLELVDREEYMLHLRISQQIPEFHSVLLDELFPENGPQTTIEIFNAHLGSKNYLKMLYCVLFLYGTDAFPAPGSDQSLLVKKRIQSLGVDAEQPELVLLRSYVNLLTM